MTQYWDEFSKSLAEQTIPRRQSLRLLGAAVAGALLSPLGLGSTLAATRDPCKAFCRCRNKSQQSACLAACKACGGETNRLCGTCGSYVCCTEPGPYENGACVDGHCEYWCAEGAADCGVICTDLLYDPDNCGACGNVCLAGENCVGGICQACIPDCGPGSTHGAGWCGDDGCGGRCACTGEGEYCPAFSNWCAVSGPTEF